MAETDDMGEKVPERLRLAIARDLSPVRPLPRAWVRALALVPAAAIVLLGIPWVMGLREDASILGVELSWGISALQMLVGIALVGLALRESIPGHALSARALSVSIGSALLLVLAVTATTFAWSPGESPDPHRGFFFRYCLRHSALMGAPLVLVAGSPRRARRLPLRPWIAGRSAPGRGPVAASGWRLFCDVLRARASSFRARRCDLVLTLLGIFVGRGGAGAVVMRRKPGD